LGCLAETFANKPTPSFADSNRPDVFVFFGQGGEGSSGKEGGKCGRSLTRGEEPDKRGGVLKNLVPEFRSEGLL
jgi:hypothetical protein